MDQIPNNWISLPPATVFRIHGEDAFSYLQSQVTQDLPTGPAGQCCYTLWLNERGRMEGDSYVFREGEEEFSLISFHTASSDLQRLIERHIIADDVEIEPDPAAGCFVGFLESQVDPGLLEAKQISLPAAGHHCRSPEGHLLFREERGSEPLYILEVSQGVRSNFSETMQAAWTRERILRKIPALPGEAGPRDTPFDLELLESAVSFTKGCFLGQEVMARLKAQGRSNRQLVTLQGSGTLPQPEESVLVETRVWGRILVAATEGEGWLALAQVRADRELPSTGHCRLEKGGEITGIRS